MQFLVCIAFKKKLFFIDLFELKSADADVLFTKFQFI